MRVSCPDEESTNALRKICATSSVPIVADIFIIAELLKQLKLVLLVYELIQATLK